MLPDLKFKVGERVYWMGAPGTVKEIYKFDCRVSATVLVEFDEMSMGSRHQTATFFKDGRCLPWHKAVSLSRSPDAIDMDNARMEIESLKAELRILRKAVEWACPFGTIDPKHEPDVAAIGEAMRDARAEANAASKLR